VNIEQLIKRFNLIPLEPEGGYINRFYQSKETVSLDRGERKCGDSIIYLITKEQFSGLHRLLCDEYWHFYAGDPVTQIIFNQKEVIERELGNTDFSNHSPQALVPANYWQSTKLKPGGKWALLGTNTFPAYEDADFEMGKVDSLLTKYTQYSSQITKYS